MVQYWSLVARVPGVSSERRRPIQLWSPQATSPHLHPMLHVRIISDYPADPDLTGWPAETTNVTIRLPESFAANGAEAHAKIQGRIEAGEFFDGVSLIPPS